jgi:hypothetical protein
MPRFNPRGGGFAGAVYSNYRSYFQPDCPNEYNENLGDKHENIDEPNQYENRKNEQNNQYQYPTQPTQYTSSNVDKILLQKL